MNSPAHEKTLEAWIFYAISGASGRSPASMRDIQLVADGINHAVPTERELQVAISFLIGAGLVERTGRLLRLTAGGQTLFDAARSSTAFETWANLSRQLKELGGATPIGERF